MKIALKIVKMLRPGCLNYGVLDWAICMRPFKDGTLTLHLSSPSPRQSKCSASTEEQRAVSLTSRELGLIICAMRLARMARMSLSEFNKFLLKYEPPSAHCIN